MRYPGASKSLDPTAQKCRQLTDRPLIVHDYFAIRGGGERLVLTLARALDAQVICGFKTDESYDYAAFPGMLDNLNLPGFLRRPGMRAAVLAARFSMAKQRVARHPLRIFSGVASVFAAPNFGAPGRNIFYCHTPPRFLYDQKDRFADRAASDPVRRWMLERFRLGYEAAVDRMDLIIANSATVQARIKTYLGRESTIVYPPCDLAAYRWIEQGDYYLSSARLAPLKRVDIIVRAFLDIPEKKLVIASSGEELQRLRHIAKNAPNISFTGWISDAELQDLIGRAIATIYVPVEEDFGMSPVESMAAGKPVIGVAEGGLRETILDDVTGVLLSPRFTVQDMVEAVRALTPARALGMRAECQLRASEFSEERFTAHMRAILV